MNDINEWLKKNCNRHANGVCHSGHCLQRGGHVKGQGQVDYDKATCEAFELGNAADILRRIIASADECDGSDGPGVPLVSIDARLIAEAREVLNG